MPAPRHLSIHCTTSSDCGKHPAHTTRDSETPTSFSRSRFAMIRYFSVCYLAYALFASLPCVLGKADTTVINNKTIDRVSSNIRDV
jgi:hypothetical protein